MKVTWRKYSPQPISPILSWENNDEIEVLSFVAARMSSGSTYEEDDGV